MVTRTISFGSWDRVSISPSAEAVGNGNRNSIDVSKVSIEETSLWLMGFFLVVEHFFGLFIDFNLNIDWDFTDSFNIDYFMDNDFILFWDHFYIDSLDGGCK